MIAIAMAMQAQPYGYSSDPTGLQTRKKNSPGAVAEPIDLGLSVKWASWNLGASRPEEYGGYYAWGETKEKDVYEKFTYQHFRHNLPVDPDYPDDNWYWDEEENRIRRFCEIGDTINDDNRDAMFSICGTEYDVARQTWGDNWRMPTWEELVELLRKCQSSVATVNGVKGWYFTGPSGDRIFLPAAGLKMGDEVSYDTTDGDNAHCCYWSGDLITWLNWRGKDGAIHIKTGEQDGDCAYNLNFDQRGTPFGNNLIRYMGLSVRPVYIETKKADASTTTKKRDRRTTKH